jgi:hypothetical protein
VGDPIYAPQPQSAALHLLSRELRLPLDPAIAAIAPPPPHMIAALDACGWID